MQHIGNSFQRFGDLLQTPVKAVVDTVLSAAEFASGLSDGVVSMDERAARTLHDTPLAGCADAVLGVAKFGAALQDGVCEMDQRIAKAIGCDLPSQTPAKSDKIAQRLQEPFVEHPLTRGQIEGTEHASRKPHTDYVEQPSSPRHAASAEHRTTHRHTAITEHPSPEPRFKESTMSQQALRMDEHSWLKSHDQEFPILEAAVRNKEHPSLKPRADVDPFPAVTAPDLPNNEYPSAKPPVQESPIVSDHLPSEEYPVWKGHLNKLPVYREVPLTDALQA